MTQPPNNGWSPGTYPQNASAVAPGVTARHSAAADPDPTMTPGAPTGSPDTHTGSPGTEPAGGHTPGALGLSGRATVSTGRSSALSTGTVTTSTLAAGTATASTAAIGSAVGIGTAAATAPQSPPRPPDRGTVYTSRAPFTDPDGRRALSGRLPRLRIGWHTASPAALARLRVSSPGTGVVLGIDVDKHPVPVRLFRPEPTRITLVSDAWAARLIALRSLAIGADIAVFTGDPHSWYGLGERATGQSGRLTVVHGEVPVTPHGSPNRPALIIYDLGLVGASSSPVVGPWQTQLTVLRQLEESGVSAVQDGDLVMLRRLQFAEAALAASALRLTGQSTQLLQRMQDEMVALVGGDADRYVWLTPTPAEHHLLKP